MNDQAIWQENRVTLGVRAGITAWLCSKSMRPIRHPAHHQSLTATETDVVRLVRDGLTNKDIAARLLIGESDGPDDRCNRGEPRVDPGDKETEVTSRVSASNY